MPNKKLLLSASICLALTGTAATALENAAREGGSLPTPRGVILYDQTDNAAGNGAPAQDFEAAYDAYDSRGADDFVVPDAEGWTITGINNVGTTGTSPVPDVDVAIHMDDGGSPGAALCDYTGVVPADNGTGSLTITLPAPCIVGPGTYWVSLESNQAFGVFGQYFWSNRLVQTGFESHWINPGDGFGTGCTDWTPQTVCGVGGGTNPDFLFQIEGSIGGFVTDADLEITKTTDGVSPIAPGSQFNYFLTATNNGPSDTTGVQVIDDLPMNVTYVSDTCGVGGGDPWIWNIGPLNNGQSTSCTITVAAGSGVITNVATISGDDNDPTGGNNSATAAVQGAPATVPTLDLWGMIAMIGTLLAGVLVAGRSRA